MIYEPEKTGKSTGFPRRNLTSQALIRTMILTLPDFKFADVDAMKTKANWISGIKDDSLFPLINLMEVDDRSDKLDLVMSELDYSYPGKPNKYKYIFKTAYRKDYHDHISQMNGMDCKVFFSDVNKGVTCHNNGSTISGMDVELFHVEQKTFGEKSPSWSVITIILTDDQECNLYETVDFNMNKFNVCNVSITIVEASGRSIIFDVVDSIYGIEIDNLYIDDVVFNDDLGVIIPTQLKNIACGRYQAVLPSDPSFGTLVIDSDSYYGSVEYYVNITTVLIQNISFISQSHFTFDVVYSGSLLPYSGLLTGDFTFTDDTHGVVTTTSFSETVSGSYEVEFAEVLDEGTIAVDDGTVTGSAPYVAGIAVSFALIDDKDDANLNGSENSGKYTHRPNVIRFEVRDQAGQLVTGLDRYDVTIDDDVLGIIGYSSNIFELTPGFYLIRTTSLVNKGNLIIDGLYQGTIPYDFVTGQVAFPNMGGSGTTDWIDQDVNGMPANVDAHYNSYQGHQLFDYDVYSIPTDDPDFFVIKRTSTLTFNGGAFYFFPKFMKYETDYKVRFYQTRDLAFVNEDIFFRVRAILTRPGDSNVPITVNLNGVSTTSYFETPIFRKAQGGYLQFEIDFTKLDLILYIYDIKLIEV